MSMTEASRALVTQAQAVVDAVTMDDSGAMVAGTWVGGNGGLLSRDTIKAIDKLRLALDAWRSAASAPEAAAELRNAQIAEVEEEQ